MAQLKDFYNRDGAEWAHPEIETEYTAMGMYAEAMWRQLDHSVPFEVRRQEALQMAEVSAEMQRAAEEPGRIEEYHIPGLDEEENAPEVFVRVAKPKDGSVKGPGILVFPGGGLTACTTYFYNIADMSERIGGPVVVFEYRHLFNGGGYPQTVNDCEAVYKWMVDNADDLGLNPDKIVLWGASSGGHLLLALAHRLKRRGYYGFEPRGCVTFFPVVDNRPIYPSSRIDAAGWSPRSSYVSGTDWLGDGKDFPLDFGPEAFPGYAEAEDCIGLPPTFIHCNANDGGSDAALAYASKLNQAGVFCDIHMWAGVEHSCLTVCANYAPEDRAEIYNRFDAERWAQVMDCFKYDMRRKWQQEG